MQDFTNDKRPRMLFVRHFPYFTGGHLKYIDRMRHVLDHGRFRPILHVTPDSDLDILDPLLPPGIERVDLPTRCEAIFVAGMDWKILDAAGQDTAAVPVINLLQHVRHGHPDHPLSQFLPRHAHRICVTNAVAEAILATGKVNGPVEVIEYGLDIDGLRALRKPRRNGRVFIAGLKDQPLARDIGTELTARGIAHDVQLKMIPRDEYLERVSQYDHAILLPDPTEGFYLPGLETMAMDVTVVMPDCVAAREYAIDEDTCLVPERTPQAIAAAAARLIADPALAATLRQRGQIMSENYRMETERRRIFDFLDTFQP